jgi:hypothetical protein
MARAAALGRRDRLVGYARLTAFLVAVLLVLASLRTPVHPTWAILPAAGFVVLLFIHESVRRAWYRARRAALFYEAGLNRLRDEWQGKGQSGAGFLKEQHPYAADIDLFGPGSLFELLCAARTHTGEATLAGWLEASAAPDEIRARQTAVAELRDQVDLREDLALLGSDVPAGVNFEEIIRWGQAPPLLPARRLRWPVLVLGLLAVACLIAWILDLLGLIRPAVPPSILLAILLAVELSVVGVFGKRVNSVLAVVQKRARDLAMLSGVLARLEQASFSSPRLATLHAELNEAGLPPS